MEKETLVKYWIDASNLDFRAMNNLYSSGDYVWSLFLGHLVIEKLLKALTIKNDVVDVPKIHDLNKLAKAANIKLDESLKDLLDIITSFNIEARYPDYKNEFYKKCNYEFTLQCKTQISELRLWLLDQLKS
jgi:HEPN domain-containing protein